MSDHLIDVKDLLRSYTVEQLNEAADVYFQRADSIGLLKKPFADLSEAAEVTLSFLHVLKVLALPPHSTILDFGCGTAWTSAIMAGLGHRVIAADVSPSALAIAREGYPGRDIEYLVFDGRTLELKDESVDAITCISALHHVPNVDTVLSELARVLRPWGVAGFSEPGPDHSRTPQSQHEMRNYTVIENDIDIDEVWTVAQRCGFTNLELNLFQPEPVLTTLDGFKGYLAGHSNPMFDASMRALMASRRLFFLEKTEPGLVSSLSPAQLDGSLELSCAETAAAGGSLLVSLKATNTGKAFWRPSDWYSAPVRIGLSITDSTGTERILPRREIPTENRWGVLPGRTIEVMTAIPLPAVNGPCQISAQLLAEFVAWFGPRVVKTIDIT